MEKESKVNPENFISIQGWMRTHLKLKGNDLLVYAIIYGFSQTENQRFTGSLQYLADWCGATKQGILKNIKNLLDKHLIVKEQTVKNGVNYVEYYTTKFNGVLNKVEQGIKQSLINNIDNTKEQTKEILSKDKIQNFGKKPLVKENLYTKCEKEIFKFSKDETVKNTLMAYLDVWITLRDKHPSYEGWKRILNKLKTQFIEEDWIDIIKNSIKKRYATFCQPTTYESKSTKKFDEHINRDGRYDSVSHERTGGKVF